MKRLALVVALIWLPAWASAQEVDADRVREAAARALVAIQKAQAPWYATNKQVCASCHHQYQPAIAYRVARDHGISLDEAIARADATKTFDFTDIDKAIQYTYVIEPAAGLSRSLMTFLVDAWTEDEAPNTKGGVDKRTVLKLDPRLAPVKAAVLPLSRNESLSPKARDLAAELRRNWNVDFDDSGAIGRVGVSLLGTLVPQLGRRRDEAIAEAALAALERFDLLAFADQPAGNLAYGQKKQLEIARALALQPTLLLLDEPAAGLNDTETGELATRLRALRDAGLTILLVEHDMPMLMRICDRIVVLDSGRKIADGVPASIRANAAVRAAYLGDEP